MEGEKVGGFSGDLGYYDVVMEIHQRVQRTHSGGFPGVECRFRAVGTSIVGLGRLQCLASEMMEYLRGGGNGEFLDGLGGRYGDLGRILELRC